MKQMVEFLARHGYWVLFVSVLCPAPEHAVFDSEIQAARRLKISVANVDQLLERARKRVGWTVSAQPMSTPI
jgi:hypothetical protein